MRRSSTMASTSDCHSDDVGSIPIYGSNKEIQEAKSSFFYLYNYKNHAFVS